MTCVALNKEFLLAGTLCKKLGFLFLAEEDLCPYLIQIPLKTGWKGFANFADWGFIYEIQHDGHRHYEVFKKRLNRRFGTVSYPTDKAFGIWVWTCMTLEKAKDKLVELETFWAIKELVEV